MDFLVDIIESLLNGILSIMDGTSGTETAANDTIRKLKNVSLILGVIMICGALIALAVRLIGHIV